MVWHAWWHVHKRMLSDTVRACVTMGSLLPSSHVAPSREFRSCQERHQPCRLSLPWAFLPA